MPRSLMIPWGRLTPTFRTRRTAWPKICVGCSKTTSVVGHRPTIAGAPNMRPGWSGGSTIVYSALNTIFLREHNRLADLLKKSHSDWTDDQLFETARNINIAILLKIIIEDYINHLSGSSFRVHLEQGFADRCLWYRTNRISLEFNLLYC